MSTKDDGGPAFPRKLPNILVPPDEAMEIIQRHAGMTLRDYFAAKAMQGALSGHHAHAGHEDYWPPVGVASYAYEMADAMLAARAKP